MRDRFEVGRRLRARRLELGLTQVQLAKKVDTVQSTISEIETGVHGCTTGMLLDILHALDMELEFQER